MRLPLPRRIWAWARRNHTDPWPPAVLEWLNAEMERLREHNRRRRDQGGAS